MKKERVLYDDDSWAEVELFRWQYGNLPYNDDRKLDPKIGLEKMADAIEEGCRNYDREKIPSPFNVCEILRYCARKIE